MQNATSGNLVLAPFDYNMVVFFCTISLSTSWIAWRHVLPAIKKNNVKYLLQEKSDKNIFQKVLPFNCTF